MNLFTPKIMTKAFPVKAVSYPRVIEKGENAAFEGKLINIGDAFFSSINKSGLTKLNPAFLFALELFIEQKGAIGVQEAGGLCNYLLTEIVDESINKLIATSYSPSTGVIASTVRAPRGKRLEAALPVNGEASDGTEIWYILLASLKYYMYLGDTYNESVKIVIDEALDTIRVIEENANKGNMYESPDAIYRLQDIIYSSITNGIIPFAAITSAAPKTITNVETYTPTTKINGKFKIFLQTETKKGLKKVKDYGDEFKLKGIEYTEEEKALIPDVPEYLVTDRALEIVRSSKYTPHRVFMMVGPAGDGKTTDTTVVAALLGIPRYVITLSDGTDETDILVKILPNNNTSNKDVKLSEVIGNIAEDFCMSPQMALLEYTGQKAENEEDCLKQLMMYCIEKAENESASKKDFIMVPSEIIKASKKPALCEIQEAALVQRAGVLPRLNSFIDDEARITLPDGSVQERNPESLFIFTTNIDYEGCRDINQSVKSRCAEIVISKDLSAEVLVARLTSTPDFEKYLNINEYTVKEGRTLAERIAKVAEKIKNYAKEQEIFGFVCGYREYSAWFFKSLAMKSVSKAAEVTILSHISFEKDIIDEARVFIANEFDD